MSSNLEKVSGHGGNVYEDDPDLNRNAIDYRDNHKYRDTITIKTEMQRK